MLNKKKAAWIDFTFILPSLIFFTIIVIIPFLVGLYYSLTDWDGVSTTFNFIWFDNFRNLFKDSRVGADIWHTVQFTFMQSVCVNVFGILLAVMLKQNNWFNNLLRTVFFIPFMFSIVFAGFVWSYMYSDIFEGVFQITNFLSTKETVLPGIAGIAIWRDSGYAMVIYLAAIQAIPESYYEAARLDGAGKIRSFFSVTLPLIMPAITTTVTLYVGWGLKTYDYVVAATNGGPGGHSETIAMLVYKYTFPYFQAGYGQALAVALMVSIFFITSSITRFLRSKEVEL